MKKLYFLDEEEKNRILNIHEGATKRQYLNEQAPLSNDVLAKDLTISELFYDEGARYGGTDPDLMVKAIQMITSPEQFWRVNKKVKGRPGNDDELDIAGVINNEFEYPESSDSTNKEDIDKIRNWLKTKLGITSTIQGNGSGSYEEGTFKITSKPIDIPSTSAYGDAVVANGLTPTAMECVKQFGDAKAAKTPGFVQVITNKATVFFSKDYEVRYRPNDGEIIYGQWACKGNVFTIMTDDGDSWSKAQGGWKNSQPETEVVDSKKSKETDRKKAYQERAKQITQQTTDTTKQIQQALGVETPSGVLDSAEIETMINKLKQ